jgi:general stress protein 26
MADSGSADRLVKLAKDIRIAMFTTVDADGSFVSRPMAQQEVQPDGDLWFFAERSSSAVAHIGANPHVGVTLSSSDTWISINGSAEIVDDSEIAASLWNTWVEAWLPQGPRDPSVVLIKVNSDAAEYWDSPGGRVTSLISFAKAKVTGERYEGGENAIVDL